MGAASSSGLALSDVEELMEETGFSAKEIQRLWRRFERLNKDGEGNISTDEFLSIPELAMNPLAMRIITLFSQQGSSHSSAAPGADAEQKQQQQRQRRRRRQKTAKARAEDTPSSSAPSSSSADENDDDGMHTDSLTTEDGSFEETGAEDSVNFRQFVRTLAVFRPNALEDDKLRFAFRIYDIRDDGFITREELMQVLVMLVGANLSQDQLQTIVDKTMIECDRTGDGKISFEEFKESMSNAEVSNRLSIRFS